MNEFVETLLDLPWQAGEPRPNYDVVIIGAGGHGLSTAYHLAARHGITNVCVLDASYIGSGNSGRNTTIIRSNYGIPESVRFYQHSLELYQRLEDEMGCWIMHTTKGQIWMAHSITAARTEQARALMNTACGAHTDYIGPDEIKRLCPQVDLTGGGRYPVQGASYHHEGATARHDRVVWAYAQGALRAGVHVFQHTPVTGLVRDGDRVTGVVTPRGAIGAGTVISAVGGHVSTVAGWAGVRLPIRTHALQAFVTNAYAQHFEPIVSSNDLTFYISQTPRGQMLIGAEFDRFASYRQATSFAYLQACSKKTVTMFPFLANLRILRSWAGICDVSTDFSPILGPTGVDGFWITTGWGTWGFKAIPAAGEQLARWLATGSSPMIAPFGIDRFAREAAMADPSSAGTR
ncbi:MAG TPA: FAD-dependent oxidoreductase [Ilumatobacteraceae bacterium]|nr:FAD-dependent oxidoreductase [Ilumatobacteraceae bacterium]